MFATVSVPTQWFAVNPRRTRSDGYPRLVYVSIMRFGQDGPKANWKGSDLVALAANGPLFLAGDSNRPLGADLAVTVNLTVPPPRTATKDGCSGPLRRPCCDTKTWLNCGH